MNLSGSTLVNSLWPSLIDKIGIDKAHKAVQQALDMQSMQGDHDTLPVLFYETCGLALANFDQLRTYTGLTIKYERMVLLLSTKTKAIQLLRDINS